MDKDRIVEVLGESRLLLPDAINAGLAANERVKYLFSLLQAACGHAARPDLPPPDLEPERALCGLNEPWLQRVVPGARTTEIGYMVPGADRLVRRMFRETEAMLRPLQTFAASPATTRLSERLESLREAAAVRGNHVDADLVQRLSSVDDGGGDSLHRLVMDLHKALNGLQATVAQTTIDGAAAYGLTEDDAALVRAFMRGVAETAPLKFDHPGLGTTATRDGARLVIQNDIGTTDAHVLVIRIEGMTAILTYTDIHLERMTFFQTLMEGSGAVWHKIENRQDESLGNNGVFHVCVGTCAAPDPAALEAYLTRLGASLVFLIDWNRARKRLRPLMAKRLALDLLLWAAVNRYGHRAFLLLGGERLVFDTLTYAAKAPLPYGARLDELLGEDSAVDYMRYLFRTAAEGLLAGYSKGLIREQAKAELITRFSSTEQLVMALVAEHAALVRQSAVAVREVVERGAAGDTAPPFDKTAQAAKEWESEADRLVIHVRALVKRSGGPGVLRRVVEEADDAIDAVEDAAFLLSLPPARAGSADLFLAQQDLAALLVGAAEAWCNAVADAPRVRRGGAREDLQRFLEAIDRAVCIERQGDVAERAARAEVLARAGDFRQLYVFSEFVTRLEGASDAIMRAAQMLSEHILSDVITA